MSEALVEPVLKGPFDAPTRYVEIGPNGPTGEILDSRRASQSYIPIPSPKNGKRKADQPLLHDDLLSLTHERVAENDLINALCCELTLRRPRSCRLEGQQCSSWNASRRDAANVADAWIKPHVCRLSTRPGGERRRGSRWCAPIRGHQEPRRASWGDTPKPSAAPAKTARAPPGAMPTRPDPRVRPEL